MRNKMKKFLAVMLSVVMAFGLVSIQSAAETTVTLTPDNGLLSTNALYLNSSVSFSGTGVTISPYNNEGIVKCDSTELDVFNWGGRGYTLTTSGWASNVLILQIYADASANKEAFSADSVYTISGKFQDASSGTVYEFEELNLSCTYDDAGENLTGWSVVTSVQAQAVNLSPNNYEGYLSTNAMYISSDVSIGLDVTLVPYNSEGIVKEGETSLTPFDWSGPGYTLKTTGWDAQTVVLQLYADNQANYGKFLSDTVYTISGKFQDASSGAVYDFTGYQVTCSYNEDGTNVSGWTVYTPSTPVTVVPDGQPGSATVAYLQFSGLSSCQKYAPVDGYVKLDGTELRYMVDSYVEIDYVIQPGWGNVHYVQLTNQLGTTYAFAEGSILEMGGTFKGEDGTIIDIADVKLVCGSDFVWSAYVEQIELAKPVVTLSGNTISWSAIDNATGYEVYVGEEKKADVTTTSYDLSTLGLDLGSYQVTVKAVGGANTVAATSDAVTYTIAVIPVTIIPDGTAGNSTVAYVQFSGVSGNQKYVPIDGYVKLDGTELRYTVDIYNEIDYAILAGGWSNVHAIKLTNALGTTYAFAEGSILEIGGTFKGEDGTIIDITEAKLICGSDFVWSAYVEQIELAKPVVTLSGNTISWSAIDNATGYEVYVGEEKKADVTTTSYDLSTLGLDLGSYQVTVKAVGGANTVAATSDAVTYTVEPTDLGTMTISSAMDGTDYNKFNNFYANTSGVTMTTMASYSGIDASSGIFLNGTKLENGYIINYGWVPNVYFVDDLAQAPETGSELIVKGTFRSGKEQFAVTATTFIWNGSAWAKYIPLDTIYNVTLTPNNVHNNTTTVYMNAATTQTISFESDKNFRPGAYNGTVALNDVVLTEGTDYIMMTSYSPNNLYLVQLQGGRTWNIGDKLTISGQFAYDGSTAGIDVASYTMYFDGLVWTMTEIVLRTPGDLNDDGNWSAVDLVRFKRYLKDGIAKDYQSITELTGDATIDDNDVRELRYIILGKRHLVDGRMISKYISPESMNIFADGPVVQNNESLLKSYFNAGFTTLIMTEDFSQVWGDDGNTSITNADGTLDVDYKNAILTAIKYGDVMIRNYTNSADYFNADLYQQLYDLGIRQFYIWDEPAPKNNGFLGFNSDEGDIPSVATMATTFANTLPSDAMFHVNLFPSYGAGNGSSWGGEISYTEYVDQYATDVLSKLQSHEKTLSVDNYPLLSDNTIRETYLRDLWYVGNKAKTYGATVNYCIQAYSEPSNSEIRTPETRADISFQTNTGLALGAQSFEYFEYYDYDASTETLTGILANDLYEEVQSVNKELKAWDHVFLSFNWQGVKAYNVDSTYTSEVTQLSTLQGISKIEATAATLVGEYQYSEDASEYGYMITNFTEPSQGTTDTVTLTVDANQELLVYTNGVGRWVNADASGLLVLSIPAGGGVYVIPQ